MMVGVGVGRAPAWGCCAGGRRGTTTGVGEADGLAVRGRVLRVCAPAGASAESAAAARTEMSRNFLAGSGMRITLTRSSNVNKGKG